MTSPKYFVFLLPVDTSSVIIENAPRLHGEAMPVYSQILDSARLASSTGSRGTADLDFGLQATVDPDFVVASTSDLSICKGLCLYYRSKRRNVLDNSLMFLNAVKTSSL